MLSLEELFCSVDDFCQVFEPQWQSRLLSSNLQSRKRKRTLCLSEIMNISISSHQSCYRNFKTYYLEKVQTQWRSHFTQLVSYNRFVEWTPSTLIPLCTYLRSCFGSCNCFVNILCGLIVYCHQPKKPEISRSDNLLYSA